MVSVALGWAAGLALNSFRLCLCGRRGWRPVASVARGRAPGVAPSGFGGVGAGAGAGAQLCRWRAAWRQGWRPAASVVLVRAPVLAPSGLGGTGPGARGGALRRR